MDNTIDEILLITEDSEFLNALAEFIDPPGNIRAGGSTQWEAALRARSEEWKMGTLLDELCELVIVAGIWKFIESSGALFAEAIAYCREIGASRTHEYLERAQGCLPSSIPQPHGAR